MTTDAAGADFRTRLLAACEASIAEDGYAKMTIADIVRRARTSRRTFYEYFSSKEECFMALLADANADQIRQISAAVDPDAPWRDQARQAIEAWIASGEARPDVTLSWIRDGPSLGAAGRALTAHSSRPRSMAYRVSSTRLCNWSLPRVFCTWFCTVRWDRLNRSAICL